MFYCSFSFPHIGQYLYLYPEHWLTCGNTALKTRWKQPTSKQPPETGENSNTGNMFKIKKIAFIHIRTAYLQHSSSNSDKMSSNGFVIDSQHELKMENLCPRTKILKIKCRQCNFLSTCNWSPDPDRPKWSGSESWILMLFVSIIATPAQLEVFQSKKHVEAAERWSLIPEIRFGDNVTALTPCWCLPMILLPLTVCLLYVMNTETSPIQRVSRTDRRSGYETLQQTFQMKTVFAC